MSAELNGETSKRVLAKTRKVKRVTLQACSLRSTRLKKQDDASALRSSVDLPQPIAACLPSQALRLLVFRSFVVLSALFAVLPRAHGPKRDVV